MKQYSAVPEAEKREIIRNISHYFNKFNCSCTYTKNNYRISIP